jgi:glucose/arabinose dehydrogenase
VYGLKRLLILILLLVNISILSLFIRDVDAEPLIKDPSLKVELVTQGLSSPTSMAFIEENKILVLEKNSGEVRQISNGILQENPVLKLRIDHTTPTCCRGLLGIAITPGNMINGTSNKKVYLYFSELLSNESVRNRVYRYEWNGELLINPVKILDLPATPGPNHPGGKLVIGKDGNVYTVIGDLNNEGLLQNTKGKRLLTDTSVIIRINPLNGEAVNNNPFFNIGSENAKKYYGYGIRNSFGLAIDPITGYLWDTENGDKDYDEINQVLPGFNSGWNQLMGPMDESDVKVSDLVNLPNSKYIDPVFSFAPSLGITGIEFFNSGSLGAIYRNNIFVGDINNGNLYFFRVNAARNGLDLDSEQTNLRDFVANGNKELSEIALGTGFEGITDIKTGLDGFLYILTFDEDADGDGKIYKIIKS